MSLRPTVATLASKRYTWRRPKEIALFYGIALALSAWVYLWDGQAFVLWGTQTAAYYVGHTAEAIVVNANASDYVGIPSDDSTPDSGARGVFTDDQEQPHTVFLRHAAILGQRAAISYLPFLPGLAVERADFERSSVIY